MFFFCYRLGVNIMGIKEENVEFAFSWDVFGNTLIQIWEPLLLGCFIMGTISSILAYILVRLIWRFTAIAKWEKRRKQK